MEAISYIQVVPDSQSFPNLDCIINYVRLMRSLGSDINYLLVGLENTKKQGYELKKKEEKP